MTTYKAREARFPGINRAVNGRLQEKDVARVVAREGDSVPEEACEVSYLTVAGCRHPFGIFRDIDPQELPERLRKKLTGCAKTFLRTCGRRMSWSGCSPANRGDEETRPEERRRSFAASAPAGVPRVIRPGAGEAPAQLSSRYHEERES